MAVGQVGHHSQLHQRDLAPLEVPKGNDEAAEKVFPVPVQIRLGVEIQHKTPKGVTRGVHLEWEVIDELRQFLALSGQMQPHLSVC